MDFLDKAVWLLALAAMIFAVALLAQVRRIARGDAGLTPAPPPPVPVPVPLPERFAPVQQPERFVHAHHHAYAYIGSGRYQCEICGALSASFADARDQLPAVGAPLRDQVIGMDQTIDEVRERTKKQQDRRQ